MELLSQNCGGLFGFYNYTDIKLHFEQFNKCDVILIQELRIDEKDESKLDDIIKIFTELGYLYYSVLWSIKGNGGCITFSKTELTRIDVNNRSLLVTKTNINGVEYMITNCYIPNYGHVGDGKNKKAFIKKSFGLFDEIFNIDNDIENFIFAGDFNAALSASDCKYKNRPGCMVEEIDWINKIINKFNLINGKVTADEITDKGKFYTYYSFINRSKSKSTSNVKGSMYIDHVFVSDNLNIKTVVKNEIFTRDHFPIYSKIKIKNKKKI